MSYYEFEPWQDPWFVVVMLIIVALFSEALFVRAARWRLAALVVYGTTATWYLLEAVRSPVDFAQFRPRIVHGALAEVAMFLLAFRILLPVTAQIMVLPRGDCPIRDPEVRFQHLLWTTAIWLLLVAVGTVRMEGDVINALFPIYGRSQSNMWSRYAGADAGATGFLVSLGAYLYTLVCALFGIFLPLQRSFRLKLLNWALICLSWPFFLLQGSRNIFLAILIPAVISFLLYSARRPLLKISFVTALLLIVDRSLRIIIMYRNVGFVEVWNRLRAGQLLAGREHEGVNMLQELCYIRDFHEEGTLILSHGGRYLAEAVSFIPRALWAAKPYIGIDYAVLRGFGGGSSDIGVQATISTGFIGQGYTNFGPYFGALAAALLFALWAAFLTALWQERASLPRLCLCLLGFGLTFNLGRDFTLLVLWPFVFGYLAVRLIEATTRRLVVPSAGGAILMRQSS